MAILKACYLSLVLIFLSRILLSSAIASFEKERFHKILGVKRKASNADIRSAYKRLAKEWHPDKTNHPNAQFKFIEIQKAYKHLMMDDAEAEAEADGTIGGIHSSSSSNRVKTDNREYSYITTTEEHLQKYLSFYKSIEITEKDLMEKLLIDNRNTPLAIVFYHERCYHCAVSVYIYRLLAEIFRNAGIRFVAMNSYSYPLMTKNFGLRPDYAGFVFVLGMRFSSYQAKQPTAENILDFISTKLRSYIFIENIKDNAKITSYLQHWNDENRVKILIMAPESYQTMRLDYLVAAYAWGSYIDFGYLHIDDNDDDDNEECSNLVWKGLKLTPQQHTLLIFNKNTKKPVASLTSRNMSKKLLWPLLKAHQYPQLPRLRTQQMLEDLCPTVAVSSRPNLCALLTWDNTKSHKLARKALRGLIMPNNVVNKPALRYLYLNNRVQCPFIEALLQQKVNNDFLGLFIILRWNESELAVEHLNNINWIDQRALQRNIESASKRLVRTCWKKTCNTLTVPEIYNEVEHEHENATRWNLLRCGFKTLRKILTDLTPALFLMVLAMGLRIFYVYLNAIELVALRRLQYYQLQNLMLRSRLLSLQLENYRAVRSNFEYALMLFIAQRRPIRSVRNLSFIHKIILRFGTLRWSKSSKRPKRRLCRLKKSRSLKLKRKSKKRIGCIAPQSRNANLSIIVKKKGLSGHSRLTRKICSSRRYTQWFLVLVPRSLLEESTPRITLN